MKKSQLKQIIKEEIKKILSNNPQPIITKPGTKEKEETEVEPKRKRRTLTPPSESPNTRPKALMKEEEKKLANKIAHRFKKLTTNNPPLKEIKINNPERFNFEKISYHDIKNLPILDLKIGKYDISKGRRGILVPFSSVNISNSTRNRALIVFNKLGIRPKKTWVAYLPHGGGMKSTFILSYYNDEPILIAQTQTESPMAGQIYIYSKYFKSGKALRLPDGEGGHIDKSSLFADSNATKEQILQALKIPQ